MSELGKPIMHNVTTVITKQINKNEIKCFIAMIICKKKISETRKNNQQNVNNQNTKNTTVDRNIGIFEGKTQNQIEIGEIRELEEKQKVQWLQKKSMEYAVEKSIKFYAHLTPTA